MILLKSSVSTQVLLGAGSVFVLCRHKGINSLYNRHGMEFRFSKTQTIEGSELNGFSAECPKWLNPMWGKN